MTAKRIYPDDVVGPYEPPPRAFTDAEGRAIRIEAYDHTDAALEALVEMYVAFDREDSAQGIPPATEPDVREWVGRILSDECHNVIAWHVADDGGGNAAGGSDEEPGTSDERPGRAVGHATLVPDREGACELAIFVLNEYQGAGIGTRITEALLGLGRERGVDRVWLTVERWNEAAIQLYEKMGFEKTDTGSFELEMAARLH